MDILKKKMAPISDKAWEEINEQAEDVFKTDLSARKFVDVDGPHGLELGSVSAGRLEIPKAQDEEGLEYGLYKVLPLLETRSKFELDLWELDNVDRGAEDIDLESLEKAAKRMARFEENVIYEGLKNAGITGLKSRSEHEKVEFPEDPSKILHAVTRAISMFKSASVEGPYSLVLDIDKWEKVSSYVGDYPLRLQLENLLDGKIILAPNLNGALLVTERGGDFRLTLGQDLSIGYESHDSRNVQLFFTESFTFQVLDPAAVINIG
ncbi:MAG: bacteriocin family protein [Bacteroidales bacterium]|nr:bacteriocin family protein [Bacteroidales bacterium]MCF8343205.1 bacteriocin family protein [Bacteroidales bacterium]MCF8351324.1 bacteriocin family protein [Bacteroidales bacterium]MCF8376872.1 bacteriocin family protein [Bacteroidales bacterium]MCF8401523.1 bacteriocin family protein [Bacteroidales bacterium]